MIQVALVGKIMSNHTLSFSKFSSTASPSLTSVRCLSVSNSTVCLLLGVIGGGFFLLRGVGTIRPESTSSYWCSSLITTESKILIAFVVSSSSSGENCRSYGLSSAGRVEVPLSVKTCIAIFAQISINGEIFYMDTTFFTYILQFLLIPTKIINEAFETKLHINFWPLFGLSRAKRIWIICWWSTTSISVPYSK